MNSLSLGFFYTIGLAWALSECCIQASKGYPLPLVLFAIGFTVIFSILGCLDLSDKALNMTGVVTASVLGLVLMIFSLASCFSSGALVGVPKVLFAGTFLLGSFSALLADDSSGEAEAEEGEH